MMWMVNLDGVDDALLAMAAVRLEALDDVALAAGEAGLCSLPSSIFF